MSLRVISGEKKGHKLKGPSGIHTRPTEDKIKEAIFNIIRYIEKDEVVLDLFAATGNIGIEFLSRGAKKVYFSEKNIENVKLIKENLFHTNLEDKAQILIGDFRKNILQVNEKIDYVYIDPPYDSDFYEKSFDLLLQRDEFKDSLFIAEYNKNIDFSEIFEKLELIYEKKYGKKYIKFYRRKSESCVSGKL